MNNSKYQLLKESHELLKSGAITEDEFNKKKVEILGEELGNSDPEIGGIVEKPEIIEDAVVIEDGRARGWWRKNKVWVISVASCMLVGVILMVYHLGNMDVVKEETTYSNIAEGRRVNDNLSISGYYKVRAYNHKNAHFYAKPDLTTQRSAYLVKGEIVFVEEVDDGFGYMEFTNVHGQSSKGWVLLEELELCHDCGLEGKLTEETVVAGEKVIDEKTRNIINLFISSVKNRDKESLSKKIVFPLGSLKNESEFIEKFDQLFDDRLTDLIVNSDVEKDWSIAPGWRDWITLRNGMVTLGPDGRIRSIDYYLPSERMLAAQSILEGKLKLHESVNKYDHPVYRIKTEKYRIHIDYMWRDNFGKEIYQFAYWPISDTLNAKPRSVLYTEGFGRSSGGNEWFEFQDDNLRYKVFIDHMDGYYDFTIYEDDEEVHNEYVPQ